MARDERSRSRSRAAASGRRHKKRQRQRRSQPSIFERLSRLRVQPEFRPDADNGTGIQSLRFTKLQQLQLLRWLLYVAVCVFCLVVQDVIMSRITILDAKTDLAAGVILLITIMEGSEVGSIFVLIASVVYYFSGSAPGAYTVGLLTVLGILATVFRQGVWNRSVGSIMLCTGIAEIVYELSLYGVGLFLGLTRWDRIFSFLMTGILTTIAMIPFYYLINRIGLIGGNTWKE